MKWSILWKRWVRVGLLTSRATGAKSERPEPSSGVAVVGTGISAYSTRRTDLDQLDLYTFSARYSRESVREERSDPLNHQTYKTVQLQMRAHPFSTFR